jgi:hypothetical protein
MLFLFQSYASRTTNNMTMFTLKTDIYHYT